MSAFNQPLEVGTPLEIIDFKVDLLSSPPEIIGEIIEHTNEFTGAPADAFEINYRHGTMVEGQLNIYVCKFKTGKCWLHIFGRMKGKEFRTERELSGYHQHHFSKERVLHVLQSSRHILQKYYLNSNIESIENHLVAFLVPA
jgi:hypothetical protein